jgi:hypothetical protein
MNKKAQLNDVSISAGIIIFLLAVGAVLPYVRADLTGNSGSTINTGAPASAMAAAATASTISIWGVMFSMAKMLVWSFGDINAWFDLIIFEPMRMIMYFIIARNIWIGGGG